MANSSNIAASTTTTTPKMRATLIRETGIARLEGFDFETINKACFSNPDITEIKDENGNTTFSLASAMTDDSAVGKYYAVINENDLDKAVINIKVDGRDDEERKLVLSVALKALNSIQTAAAKIAKELDKAAADINEI